MFSDFWKDFKSLIEVLQSIYEGIYTVQGEIGFGSSRLLENYDPTVIFFFYNNTYKHGKRIK